MLTRVPRVAVGIVVLVLLTSTALAVPVKDQYQEGFAGSQIVGFLDPDNYMAAQTFTPAISGLLDSIQIHSGAFADSGSGVKLSILTTSGGVPTSNLLGSVFALTSGYLEDDWNTINLASLNLVLTAGTTYALKLETTAGPDSIWWDYDYWVPGVTPDPYTGGDLYVDLNGSGWALADAGIAGAASYVDAMFRTFMDTDIQTAIVPEPFTLGLVGIGLAGLLARKHLRRT